MHVGPAPGLYVVDLAGAIAGISGNTRGVFAANTGDVDGSGRVDDADTALLLDRMGEVADASNAHLDLDQDGVINLPDVEIIELHLGGSTCATAR